MLICNVGFMLEEEYSLRMSEISKGSWSPNDSRYEDNLALKIAQLERALANGNDSQRNSETNKKENPKTNKKDRKQRGERKDSNKNNDKPRTFNKQGNIRKSSQPRFKSNKPIAHNSPATVSDSGDTGEWDGEYVDSPWGPITPTIPIKKSNNSRSRNTRTSRISSEEDREQEQLKLQLQLEDRELEVCFFFKGFFVFFVFFLKISSLS